jgi:hypothetical protein
LIGACGLCACSFRIGAKGDGVSGQPIIVDDMAQATADVDMAQSLTTTDDMAKKPPPPSKDMATTPPAPHITVSNAPTAATINLTTLGTSDWAHWGFNSKNDFDHKAAGSSQISNITLIDNASLTQFNGYPTKYSWTDGMTGGGGHATATNSTTGVYTGVGGVQFTVPAGVATRRLILYASLFNAQEHLHITVGDGPDKTFDDTTLQFSDGTLHDYAFVIDYSAAADNDTLTVTWSIQASLGVNGAVGLNSAVLTTTP